MSRNAWKKRSGGVEAPPQLLDLCRSIFFALRYEAETFEEALDLAARNAGGKTRSAVKAYLTHVADGEHAAEDLVRIWSRAARTAGWIFEGDARSASLALRTALSRMPHEKRHG